MAKPMKTSSITFRRAKPMITLTMPDVAQMPVTDWSNTVARTPTVAKKKMTIPVTSFGNRGTGLPEMPAISPSHKKTVTRR